MVFIPNFITAIASVISIGVSGSYTTAIVEKLKNSANRDAPLPFPFVALILNNFIWFVYSIALGQSKDGTPEFFIDWLHISSFFAVVFSNVCLIQYFFLCDNLKRKLVAILIPIPILCIVLLWLVEPRIRMYNTKYLGPIGIASGIVMYASPIVQIAKCIKEKSLEELPSALCPGLFMQGSAWCVAAVVIKKVNVYLAVTSGIGMALVSIMQLGMFCMQLKYSESPATVHPEPQGLV